MKKDKKHYAGILLGSLLVIAAGILIVIFKDQLLLVAIMVAGIAILIDGLYTLFNFKNWHFSHASTVMAVVKGIIQIVVGLLGVFLPLFAGEQVLSVLMYVVAVVLIVSAIISIENAIVFKKANKELPVSNFIASAAVSLLLAVVLFSNPTGILSAVVLVIGIAVICAGVGMFFWSLKIRKMLKASATVIESSYEETDSKDDK